MKTKTTKKKTTKKTTKKKKPSLSAQVKELRAEMLKMKRDLQDLNIDVDRVEIEDMVDDAVREIDLDDKVEDAVRDYNFDYDIERCLDDYDFSEQIGDALEYKLEGIKNKVLREIADKLTGFQTLSDHSDADHEEINGYSGYVLKSKGNRVLMFQDRDDCNMIAGRYLIVSKRGKKEPFYGSLKDCLQEMK